MYASTKSNTSSSGLSYDPLRWQIIINKICENIVIGKSLKTTNIIESVNAQAGERCGLADNWVNSNQKQRWLAAALIDIEPRLNRLSGYRHLPALRAAIMKELKLDTDN